MSDEATDISAEDPRIAGAIRRVAVALDRHFAESEGVRLRSLETLDVIARPFSLIAFLLARTSAGDRRLTMKKIVHHPVNRSITERENQAVVEYGIMRRLYPRFLEVEGCGVPRPVLLIPEVEAFVTTFVSGRRLSEVFSYARHFASVSGFRALRRDYFLCGRWLRCFQEFTGREPAGPEAFEAVLERCDLQLGWIEKAGARGCPPGLRERTTSFLWDQVWKLKEGNVLVAGRHGDFGHWNILTGPDGIVVLDFMGYAKEPVLIDLLKLLLSFEAWRNHPAYSRRRLAALERSVRDGFGDPPPVPDAVARICEVVQRISMVYACVLNPGCQWYDRWRRSRTLKENLGRIEALRRGGRPLLAGTS